jgi:hypothetical protein
MKRHILIIASVLALLLAGAVYAQSPQNTTAPGPTQQQEPGQTNNNLPNPGHPVQVGPQNQTPPVQEQGTVEGTATESINNTQGANTTGQVTGTTGTTTGTQDTTMTHPETESTNTPVDVDVDTGNRANGAVDVDVSTKPDADTDASGVNETGETTGSYSGTSGNDTNALPSTASELPLVALIGLLALGTAFALRVKRNA